MFGREQQMSKDKIELIEDDHDIVEMIEYNLSPLLYPLRSTKVNKVSFLEDTKLFIHGFETKVSTKDLVPVEKRAHKSHSP